MEINIKNKIEASLVLGSYLDTLGFKNGEWEFNFNRRPETFKDAFLIQNEIIHNYYSLGGINIDISKWNASDDTIMMIATKKACLNGDDLKNFMIEYLKIYDDLKDFKRGSGITTLESLKKLSEKKTIKYNENMGGNGAAMRTSYIGIKFYKEKDIDKLVEASIYSSRLTHNYPMGFLGGLVTALFTSFAIRNINPFEWGSRLLKLEEDGIFDKYMKTSNIFEKYKKDKEEFFDLWKKFVELRLPIYELKTREYLYSADRYNDLLQYTPGVNIKKKDQNYNFKSKIDLFRFASTGVGGTIVAYDSLLMSISSVSQELDDTKKLKFSWENLVYFSTLHFGDNDSTGIIAGCWFGALRGIKDISKEYYEKIKNQLEFKKELF